MISLYSASRNIMFDQILHISDYFYLVQLPDMACAHVNQYIFEKYLKS